MCKNLVAIDFQRGDRHEKLLMSLLDEELKGFYQSEPYRLLNQHQMDFKVGLQGAGMELTKRAILLARAEKAEHCAYVFPVVLDEPTNGDSTEAVFMSMVTPTRPLAMFVATGPVEELPPVFKHQIDDATDAILEIYRRYPCTEEEQVKSNELSRVILRSFELLGLYAHHRN